MTTNDGQLLVFDPPGERAVGATFDATDPPLLLEAPEASASGVVWIAVCRRMQQVSGHDLRGKVVWTRQLPWEAWSLVKAGPFAIVASADGRVRALDRSGTARFEGDASGSSSDQFAIDEAGKPLRVTRRNVHLICAAFDGRVRWRAVAEEPLGSVCRGSCGRRHPHRPLAGLVQGERGQALPVQELRNQQDQWSSQR